MRAWASFVGDEGGAAAVDWVVMTAATVTLGLAVMTEVSDAVETAGNRLAGQLADMPIRTSFEEWEALRNETESSSGTGDQSGGNAPTGEGG